MTYLLIQTDTNLTENPTATIKTKSGSDTN